MIPSRVKKKPSRFTPKGKTPKKQQVGTATKVPKRGTGTTQSRSGSSRSGGGTSTSSNRRAMPSMPTFGKTGATTKKTTTTPSVTRSRQSTTGGVSSRTKPKTNMKKEIGNTGGGTSTGRGSAGIPKKGKKGPGMSAGKTVPTYNEVVRRKTGGRV